MARNRTRDAKRRGTRSTDREAASTGAMVLGEGIAITGELRIKAFGIGLLPIEVKLMISSATLAEALGLAWWSARRVSPEGVAVGSDSSNQAGRRSPAPVHRNGTTRRDSRRK